VAINRETLRRARVLVSAVGDQADHATRLATAAWLAAWRELEPMWTAALTELLRSGQPVTSADVERERVLRAAITRTYFAAEALARYAAQLTTVAAGEAVRLTAADYPAVIASQLPAEYRAAAAARYAARSPGTALDVMLARVAETIHSLTLPLPGFALKVIKERLVLGIGLGLNPNQTARQTVRELRNAFDLPLTRAVNIVRTETLDAYRNAARLIDMANADVLAGWRWAAQMDRRTCPSCWSKHGTLYSVDTPGPWDHQQGRCARVPELRSWAELGLPGKEPQSALPDARKVFAGLPASDQLAIMGPARLELLQSGKVGWSDLSVQRSTPGWRDSFAARPVGDLKK
jgi:SPP1 gp7 family putative phage head morphogenesis protein